MVGKVKRMNFCKGDNKENKFQFLCFSLFKTQDQKQCFSLQTKATKQHKRQINILNQLPVF